MSPLHEGQHRRGGRAARVRHAAASIASQVEHVGGGGCSDGQREAAARRRLKSDLRDRESGGRRAERELSKFAALMLTYSTAERERKGLSASTRVRLPLS